MVYTARPDSRRREKPHQVTWYRLTQWGRWKRNSKRAQPAFPSVSPMFAPFLPQHTPSGDGEPPPAIKEVIDAMPKLSDRRQRILGWVFVDREHNKAIAAREGVTVQRVGQLIDAAVEAMDYALHSGI